MRLVTNAYMRHPCLTRCLDTLKRGGDLVWETNALLRIFQTIFLFYCVKWKPLVVSGFVYPGWANAIGWMLSLASLSCVPAYATYTLCKGKGTLREVSKVVYT